MRSGESPIKRSVSGPRIVFTVTKPEVTVEKEGKVSIPNWVKEYSVEIAVLVIAGVLIAIIVACLKRRLNL